METAHKSHLIKHWVNGPVYTLLFLREFSWHFKPVEVTDEENKPLTTLLVGLSLLTSTSCIFNKGSPSTVLHAQEDYVGTHSNMQRAIL